jgi:mRNA-degrading endonuclease toxin of MazEF toxin-antitoxin module
MPGHAARVALTPDQDKGLDRLSFVMIDKIVSIGRLQIRKVLGHLRVDDVDRVDLALRRWLAL